MATTPDREVPGLVIHPMFRSAERLRSAALELIERCGCESGCPACTGPEGEIAAEVKPRQLRFCGECATFLRLPQFYQRVKSRREETHDHEER